MKKFKPGIFLTSIFTLLAFMSVLYTSSCNNKPPALSPFTCENVVCQNYGYCNKGTCVCPAGYQGLRCDTEWSAKFIGTWNIHEVVTSSDYTDSNGHVRNYTLAVDTTASPTSIFLNNLRGVSTYNNISGVIDSTKIGFVIKAFTPVGNGNFNLKGGYARLIKVVNGRDTVTGTYYTDYLNAQSLREHDTISFLMTK